MKYHAGWRISAAKYSKSQTFSGDGGLYAAGRWNYKGDRIVYASDSLALATLEVYVRLGKSVRQKAFKAYQIEIPEGLKILDITPKEVDTNALFSAKVLKITQEAGSRWLSFSDNGGGSAVARVQSAIIHQEYNYLLNPAHPDFKEIIIHDAINSRFDPRL